MRRLPDRPISNIAINLSNLGSFMTIKGEYARAEALLRESQDLNRQTVGEKHLRRALPLRVKALKPGHSAIAGTQGALGECLTAQGRYAEAEPLLKDSHRALEASLGGRDPRTQKALRRLDALSEAWRKPPPQ